MFIKKSISTFLKLSSRLMLYINRECFWLKVTNTWWILIETTRMFSVILKKEWSKAVSLLGRWLNSALKDLGTLHLSATLRVLTFLWGLWYWGLITSWLQEGCCSFRHVVWILAGRIAGAIHALLSGYHKHSLSPTRDFPHVPLSRAESHGQT